MRGIWPFRRGEIWIDETALNPLNYDADEARRAVCLRLDDQGFDWQIFLVSALGFLTDSYALFATNVVLPSLGYIYWPDVTNGRPELIINCLTLAGCMVGQILFGFLADKFGRRRLYGVELVIVIFSSLGMAQSSTGKNNSMNILWWIYFWRFFIGLGIGAEYPLTAVITAEFADVNHRARMMAAVFLMQPVGQLLAAGVGWAVLTSLGSSNNLPSFSADPKTLSQDDEYAINQTIDVIWRCVIGVGAAPAILALLFRLTIPESPRYTMDVAQNAKRALLDIVRFQDGEDIDNATLMANMVEQAGVAQIVPVTGQSGVGEERVVNGQSNTATATALVGHANNAEGITANGPTNFFTRQKLGEYFYDNGNWRYLAATSLCWFLLDFAFYGLGINSPRQLAAIWSPNRPDSTPNSPDDWQNPFDPKSNLYLELYYNAQQYIVTISIGSMLGSITLILLINKIRRKSWLYISFIILAISFAITAATLKSVEFLEAHWLTVALYAFCQFFFNFGPNSLTFIIPAEIFPTQYRCTCHGISAAMGKLGSISVQLVLYRTEFSSDPGHLNFALGLFAILMALGGLLAWAWLPDVQGDLRQSNQMMMPPSIPSKTLEALAKGWLYATANPPQGEGQTISLRRKTAGLFRFMYQRLRIVCGGDSFGIDSEHELEIQDPHAAQNPR